MPLTTTPMVLYLALGRHLGKATLTMDVLDSFVGVENVCVDLTPDLEREGAEELGVDL